MVKVFRGFFSIKQSFGFIIFYKQVPKMWPKKMGQLLKRGLEN
jgi:hypothetical protein